MQNSKTIHVIRHVREGYGFHHLKKVNVDIFNRNVDSLPVRHILITENNVCK